MIVSNSSPLISLGKIGKLGLFQCCFSRIIIPDAVYHEITQKEESPETIAIQKAIEEKWIAVEKIEPNPVLKTEKLGKGEQEAISLAVQHNAILIIDDDTAKMYARLMGIEAHGTLFVVFSAWRKGLLSREGSIDLLNLLVKNGFYLSTEVYAEVLNDLSSSW